jgi:hypothetical protein
MQQEEQGEGLEIVTQGDPVLQADGASEPGEMGRWRKVLHLVTRWLLILLFFAGVVWVLDRLLTRYMGDPIQTSLPPYDLKGRAAVHFVQAVIQEEECEISWEVENRGEGSWWTSTHHWAPLDSSLPPIPLPQRVEPGDRATIKLRLPVTDLPIRLGWQLTGPKGPVEGGLVDVQAQAPGDERAGAVGE